MARRLGDGTRPEPRSVPPVTQDDGDAPFAPSAHGVGLVLPRQAVLPGALSLESGRVLHDVTVSYETYGALNVARDNVVLLCHALSGDAHAAGYHTPRDVRPGWWDTMVGPGKAFDTDRYHVICTNVLGGCAGTTGPASIDPRTGAPYGPNFPVVTIADMVEVQARLLDTLGIARLAAVAGGSMGGMQALQWAVSHPHRVDRAIVLASCARLSTQALAFNEVARQAIMGDPRWREGRYPADDPPDGGLAAARMIGHLTYLSAGGMQQRFGRHLRDRERVSFSFDADFQVQSYLRHQGASFVQRFDANSYLYITRAMDYFDLSAGSSAGTGSGSLSAALSRGDTAYLVVAVDTDWLYPTHESLEIVDALRAANQPVRFIEINSPHGHDAFLIEHATLTPHIAGFLRAGA